MKKILLFMAALSMASCSDDAPANNNPESPVILPQRTVTTKADGNQLTTTYSYDGNKLTGISYSDGSAESYNYIETYLTEIRYYKNGGLVQKNKFLYNGGGLAACVKNYYNLSNPSASYSVKGVYTFTSNLVTVSEFTGDENSQTTPLRTLTLQLATNGNVVKYDDGTTVINYSYDYLSNPFKNLYAYGILLMANYKDGVNNINGTQTITGGTTATTTTTYTYNQDYPVTATQTSATGSQSVTQYFY